ncbi:acyl-CoA thioesterase [Qipengyuania spongiae]|uniref:Acyl-CoA thioesterase n=1 Tax=Qipengyuania spongiae TaxID=2909673 RepID=A0ABY5T457_9SPHN|nr:thioesterase family protein [Qipengyuania spongiae]UVI40101.1 acyl-CoA thioesterase [Qipengyuania spongiae]
MSQAFTYRFRVRYAEVDAQAIVFNSRYLEYADLMVSEFFRDRRPHGMPGDIEFHVRKAEVDYLAPIRFDELIEGTLRVERIGGTSMTMRIDLRDADADERAGPRATIRLTQVHVDLAVGRPARIPDTVRRAFGFSTKATVDA